MVHPFLTDPDQYFLRLLYHYFIMPSVDVCLLSLLLTSVVLQCLIRSVLSSLCFNMSKPPVSAFPNHQNWLFPVSSFLHSALCLLSTWVNRRFHLSFVYIYLMLPFRWSGFIAIYSTTVEIFAVVTLVHISVSILQALCFICCWLNRLDVNVLWIYLMTFWWLFLILVWYVSS